MTRKLNQVVRADSVGHLTAEGWQLVDRIEHAQRIATARHVIECGHNEPDPRPGYGDRWIPEKYGEKAEVITEPLFVLERDADEMDREQHLKDEIDAANRVIAELRFQAEENKKAHAKLVDERSQAESNCAKAEEARNASNELNRKLREQMATMERDAAKIRKELGDGRWRALGLEMLNG